MHILHLQPRPRKFSLVQQVDSKLCANTGLVEHFDLTKCDSKVTFDAGGVWNLFSFLVFLFLSQSFLGQITSWWFRAVVAAWTKWRWWWLRAFGLFFLLVMVRIIWWGYYLCYFVIMLLREHNSIILMVSDDRNDNDLRFSFLQTQILPSSFPPLLSKLKAHLKKYDHSQISTSRSLPALSDHCQHYQIATWTSLNICSSVVVSRSSTWDLWG